MANGLYGGGNKTGEGLSSEHRERQSYRFEPERKKTRGRFEFICLKKNEFS